MLFDSQFFVPYLICFLFKKVYVLIYCNNSQYVVVLCLVKCKYHLSFRSCSNLFFHLSNKNGDIQENIQAALNLCTIFQFVQIHTNNFFFFGGTDPRCNVLFCCSCRISLRKKPIFWAIHKGQTQATAEGHINSE